MNTIAFTDTAQGLSSTEIAFRPKNTVHRKKSVTVLLVNTIGHQIGSLFFLLLVISGILSSFLKEYTEAGIFVAIAFINTVLGTIQEFKATHAAAALETLIAHSVTVIRDGVQREIGYEKLVAGDIVLLTPGDVVAADMNVREARDLFVDESVRTGESAPIVAVQGQSLFAGTSVASGTGIGQVLSVGKENSLVSYGKTVDTVKKGNSFERFIGRISRALFVAVCACIIVTGIHAYMLGDSYSLSDLILYAVSMLVAIVPESLPLVITVILMREALFLVKEKVLIKRLRALQELGSLEYLFTDKTGTLTQNNVHVVETDEGVDFVVVASTICDASYERTPLDKTFDEAIGMSLRCSMHNSIPVTVTPFKTDKGYATYTFGDKEIIRGQFQAVYAATGTPIPPQLLEKYNAAEAKGLRIIALASRSNAVEPFTYNGYFAFEDPLKPDAAALYRQCQDIDVPIIIMTGDSAAVGTYIAQKLDQTLTPENVFQLQDSNIDTLSNIELDQMRVYSRCRPEQKLSIIQHYQTFGTVGFIGDGINDALALKAADVGIVVNNASDVARQSADILLFEKSLKPVITAIRMSRRMYAHIMTYLICTLVGNVGTLVSLTVVSLVTKNLPILPIQILLNNLLTDIPLLLLAGDTLEDSVEKKRPHFTAKKVFAAIVLFAVLSSLFDFAYFIIFRNTPLSLYRTGWFVFSVFAELVLIFSLRSNKSVLSAPKIYRPLLYIIVLCGVVTLTMPYISLLQKAFVLVPIPLWMMGTMAVLIGIYVIANEMLKKVRGGIVR